MRVTAPSLWEIQTAPAPKAMPSGPSEGPTGIVAVARFVAGSIRVTAPPLQSATQTAPAPATTPIGPCPTGTTAATLFVAWSMRSTALRSKLVTQAEPSGIGDADRLPRGRDPSLHPRRRAGRRYCADEHERAAEDGSRRYA